MDYGITRAFKKGDYKRASELLQNARDFKNRDLLWVYPQNYTHINYNKYSVTLLHLAAYHGWLDICEQLITDYKYNPHVQNGFGSLTNLSMETKFGHPPPPPPLFYATMRGHYGVVKYLINKGNCDPLQHSIEGETPLYLACLAGHYDIVTYLLLKCHVVLSYNPLHGACKMGNLKIVNCLTSLSSIDVNIKDGRGYTPLHTACHYGHLDIIKFLVSLPSVNVNIQDGSGYTPLITACSYGHLDIIKFLVSLPDVNIRNDSSYSPLYTACCYGHLQILKFLVSLPSTDVNIRDDSGCTPLHTACHYGHLDIIKFLLSLPTADVNIRDDSGYTPLHTACRYGHLHIIKLLVSLPSADVNIRDDSSYTPLHTACRYGHLHIIKFLVYLPSADVNIRDDTGYTPLHTACCYGHLDIIKFLLSLPKTDVNIRDDSGYTPLHTAYDYGHLGIIKFLLSLSSINVNIRIPSYPLLLHKACCNGTINVVKFLVSSSSVDVNSKHNSGCTPLHTACHYGHLDIIKFLLSLPTADVNNRDDSGYTPLHIACRCSHLDIIMFLVSLPSVDVNIQDGSGYTPLYTACCYGHLQILKFLVSLASTDVNIRDDSGCTPLHTVCHYGHLDIIKFLLSLPTAVVNIQDDSGYTPLHTACRYSHLDVIKFLLSFSSINVNIRIPSYPLLLHKACRIGTINVVKFLVSSSSIDVNSKHNSGCTPLHTACCYGHIDIIKFLVSLPSVDVNIQDGSGYTPLHPACHYGHLDIVKLLVSLPSVDVNIQDGSGYTPLTIACRYGQLDIIKFVVSLPDVNMQDGSGYTPLTTACRYGHLDIIQFLVSLLDVNIQDGSGYTPLTTACRYGHLDIIKFLVSLPSIEVNIQDGSGYTPLHTACHYGKLDIVKFLMSTEHVNPISADINGNTVLHYVCSSGNVDLVKYLLSTGRIDPMAKNRYQETPLQMAGNRYYILKLFEPFKQCRVDFPVESYSKAFLCGNTTNGKSSLANALCQRVKGISLLEHLNPFKQQEKAEPLTAGIVPHHLESNEIGNIVLYDFAGHPEYYSSHEAVLENLMLRSPAVFIVLIKLTDKLEDIEKQLYYWAGFLENIGSRMSKKSQVIVVGSHADKRKAENGINLIKRFDIQSIMEHHEYKGFIAVDCRNKNGVGFNEFVVCLSESTKSVVNTSESISFYCHVLYAFLKTKLDQVAINLDNLLQVIQDENEPSLPSNESILIEFLTILSDKGLILFIRSTNSINSWVIINKTSLLKKINGTLFAPSHFKEYRSTLVSNTGIVPVSVLSDVFPQYDPDMLVGFLKSLEFCHEIDENTLQIISNTLPPRYSYSDKLLYFPALASEPMKNVEISNGFGWCLWCPEQIQFFSARFLHVLLLRLAHKSSLKRDDGIITPSTDTRINVKDLNRSCNVWKNGICWTRDGVKCIVQVSEQNRSVILLVQPVITGSDKECIQVRNSIITMIHLIRNEFCSSCDIQEYLISPNQLHSILHCELSKSSIFRIEHIARATLFKMPVTNKNETLELSSLLGQLEPYHILPLSVIQQLFDDSKTSQCIPEHLYREIRERCRPIMDIYLVTSESSTYQSVRDHLNRFSIFGGRNPFVSE